MKILAITLVELSNHPVFTRRLHGLRLMGIYRKEAIPFRSNTQTAHQAYWPLVKLGESASITIKLVQYSLLFTRDLWCLKRYIEVILYKNQESTC